MAKVSKPRTATTTSPVKPAVVKAAAPRPAPAPKPVPVQAPEPVAPIVEAIAAVVPEPAEIAPTLTDAVARTDLPPAATKDIAMDTIKTATDKAQTLFTEMNTRTKAAVEKSTAMFAEANEFGKGNIEAVVESAKIAAKGFESMGQDAAEYGRKSFENATAAMKSLSSVKSPTDFFKLQSDFVRGAFDAMVAESSRSTEAMLKLAGEVAQPISSRAALAVEKVKLAA